MFYRFFSHNLSNMDSIPATVVGCTAKGVYIVAMTYEGEKVTGFCPASAAIGSKLVVAPVKQFPDGEFLFQIESIIECAQFTSADLIKSSASTRTTTAPNVA